jgi:metal iron transporter
VEDAPLEFGGHREAEEPTRGFVGALGKFARFFGPGMIVTVAYIDPDNFQSAVEDGQDFQYKMLFMVFISVLIAMYLQVGDFYGPLYACRADPLGSISA